MFGIKDFYLFLTVSILINIAPGPDMLYTAARSLSQGVKAGILSALGIATGCLFHIGAAVFGLSEIIEHSVLLFAILKYAGAGYLIFLGVKMLVKKSAVKNEAAVTLIPNRKIYWQGVITNILNPKVAIFFLSFLPQFINSHSPHIREQIAFLGLWFDIQGALVLIIVAILTGFFKRVLVKNVVFMKWQEKVAGVILVGLGLKILLSRK